MKYGENIKETSNEKKLSDPELLNIEELKWPILRIKLLRNLLNDNQNFPQYLKREFSNDTAEEEDNLNLDNEIPHVLIHVLYEMVKKKDKNSFINLIRYINENIKDYEIIIKNIEILIPYYKFRKSNLDEISCWLPLILKLIKQKQKFKIKFNDNIEYKFEGSKDSKFNNLKFYFVSDKLTLSSKSEYEVKVNKTEFKYTIKEDKKDKEAARFYYFVTKVLDNKLSEKIIKEIEEHRFS